MSSHQDFTSSADWTEKMEAGFKQKIDHQKNVNALM
tara:strand:- start:1166 stop:1273 length:108 start_codon:yes stop_codon:yes gene_type:complete